MARVAPAGLRLRRRGLVPARERRGHLTGLGRFDPTRSAVCGLTVRLDGAGAIQRRRHEQVTAAAVINGLVSRPPVRWRALMAHDRLSPSKLPGPP